MRKFINWLFWKSKPFIEWVDRKLTWPYSIKKINGNHYYLWRDRIDKGHAFLTNIEGMGSNYINPSKFKHGAIYFGRGLKTQIYKAIDELNLQLELSPVDRKVITDKIDRLLKVLIDFKVNDEIYYVIEAVGKGVVPTGLVTFLTTKDRVVILEPEFTDFNGMSRAADIAVFDLGLPYDFGFSHDDSYKYCFEVVADAYEKACRDVKLKRVEYKLFGWQVYNTFLADTFLDEEKWCVVLDSETEKL